jgi:hypothetical protein
MNPKNPMNFPIDREEMIRLTREGMENTMRFFMTMNENLLKMTDWQRDAINETNKKTVEVMNKSYEEFQKQNRVVLSRIEQVCHQALETVAPVTPKTMEEGK